jgi:hypothetical protein
MCCSDDVTCDCTLEETIKFVKSAVRKGWEGKPPVAIDGDNWPLDFAAKTLGLSERDLRDLVRITGLEPAGTMSWSNYRRSGRNPRVYNASKLVKIFSTVKKLTEEL